MNGVTHTHIYINDLIIQKDKEKQEEDQNTQQNDKSE